MDYLVGDTLYFMFTTRQFSDGVPTVLSNTPVVSAYENDSATQITAGITLGVSHDSVVGMNLLTIVATGANGYEAGKDYNLVITTGTVGGVSVIGEVVGTFSLGRSAAAQDLANGTDGLTALKTIIDAIKLETDKLTLGDAGAGSAGSIIEEIENRPTTAMRGTDNVVTSGPTKAEMDTAHALLATTADLLDKLGAVNEAAAAGDPSATESVMQYVKQIVNILAGAAGVVTFPAEAAPGNAVSLAEVLRAIHVDVTGLAGSAMRGTNSAATATALSTAQSDLDTLTGAAGVIIDDSAANDTTMSDALWDEGRSGHTTAGTFGEQMNLVVFGTVDTSAVATTTTSFESDDITEVTTDHFKGRTLVFLSGALKDQATDITAYSINGGRGVFTFTAMTEAAGNNNRFAII